MLLRTAITSLAIQNITQLIPTRVDEGVCQTSTVVLSVSSTTITAANGSISTSYSIYPVNKHISQTIRPSITIPLVTTEYTSAQEQTGRSDAAISYLSSTTPPRGEEQTIPVDSRSSSLQGSQDITVSLTPTWSPLSTGHLSVSSGSSSESTSTLTLVLSNASESSLSQISTSSSRTPASRSDTQSLSGLSVTTSTGSTTSTSSVSPSVAASTNPVLYTCPRDNGIYYSDTENRVYQLLCNTDESDATIGMDYQPYLQSCVDSCGDISECLGVSYAETTGLCSYKSSASNRVGSSSSNSAILADYVCPGADGTQLVDSSGSIYQILCNTFFPASNNITSNLETPDLASCSEICSDTSDCSGFTFQNGTCTLVNNRNSNDGIARVNVATAILLSKRIVQVVSSGIPYRSTSLAESLPLDISRTPSSTRQSLTIYSTTTRTSQSLLSTVGSAIPISSETTSTNTDTVSLRLSIIPSSNSLSSWLLSTISPERTISASSTVFPASISSDGAPTQPADSVTPSYLLTVEMSSISKSSETTSSDIRDFSVITDSQSSITNSLPTIVIRSSPAAVLFTTSSSTSLSQSLLLSTISGSSVFTDTALLSSTLVSATTSAVIIISRPTSAATRTSSRLSVSQFPSAASLSSSNNAISPSSVFLTSSRSVSIALSPSVGVVPSPSVSIAPSSPAGPSLSIGVASSTSINTAVSSTIDMILFSSVGSTGSASLGSAGSSSISIASSPVVSSSLPHTTYSCPAADGDQVQANTGGLYTIGCDEETTGGGVLAGSSTDFNGCMTYCDETPGCTAWTYNGSCYLKTGASASDFSFHPSTRGTVSGIRFAPARPGGSGPVSSSISSASSASSISSTPSISLASSVSTAPSRSSVSSSPQLAFSASVASSMTVKAPSSYVVSSSSLNSESTAFESSSYSVSASSTIAIVPSSSEPDSSTSLYQPTSQTISTSDLHASSLTDIQASLLTSILSGDPSAVVVSKTIKSASTIENIIVSTSDSRINDVSNLISTNTASATGTLTVELGATSNVLISDVVATSTNIEATVSLATTSYITIPVLSTIAPSLTESISRPTVQTVGSLLTVPDPVPPSTTIRATVSSFTASLLTITTAISLSTTVRGTSPTASCSVYDNVLDICLDTAITPSVGAGGGISVGLGSSTITIVAISASLDVAPSVAASGDLGVSAGTNGIGIGASATIGVDPDLSGSLHSSTRSSIPSMTSLSSRASLPSVTCSAGGNVLNVCIDAAITPSVGVGGNAGVGIVVSSSTITLLDVSASLAVAPSLTVGIDLGLSVGSNGIGLSPSATIGVDLGLQGSSRSATTTALPTVSCSAGGNVLDICVDAAVTPSVGIGGNAGVGVVVGSSTITILDASASLAVVPSMTAGANLGLSIGSSGIVLSPSAAIGAGLNLDASGTITVGPILPTIFPSQTSTTNCSAGGNALDVCIDATITPSIAASVALNLNLGPSSSALTLLDVSASVALAPSVAVGLDLGLSVGSSGLGLTPSATVGLDLGLELGLGLGGSAQSKSSFTASLRSTSSVSSAPALGSDFSSASPTTLPSSSRLPSATPSSTQGVIGNVTSKLQYCGSEKSQLQVSTWYVKAKLECEICTVQGDCDVHNHHIGVQIQEWKS
ncbi:hypothetical protein D6C92_09891 [Aureobasidium pullulans]|nr:hypothetical protein D6C92_09891 [Aureobasidium pullulans]